MFCAGDINCCTKQDKYCNKFCVLHAAIVMSVQYKVNGLVADCRLNYSTNNPFGVISSYLFLESAKEGWVSVVSGDEIHAFISTKTIHR